MKVPQTGLGLMPTLVCAIFASVLNCPDYGFYIIGTPIGIFYRQPYIVPEKHPGELHLIYCGAVIGRCVYR